MNVLDIFTLIELKYKNILIKIN